MTTFYGRITFGLSGKMSAIFFGSYLKGANWNHDEFHQLFWNFKKKLDTGGQRYKRQDIQRVGRMIAEHFVPWVEPGTLFVPVPPSAMKGAPGYDDRCQRALQVAKKTASVPILVRDIIRQLSPMPPAHSQPDRPRPEHYKSNYEIVDKAVVRTAEWVVIFDDLITTGAHFRAISDMVQALNPSVSVTGLFLGRRKVSPVQ